MAFYIRFTADIQKDIKRGFSKNIHGQKLNGLCAWSLQGDFNPYEIREVIAAGKAYAAEIARNTYGGYGSDTEFAIVEGTMTGGYTNDGTLIRVTNVIGEYSL